MLMFNLIKVNVQQNKSFSFISGSYVLSRDSHRVDSSATQ